MIVGIDEVGRGPWAGPLVVGAVVLGAEIEGLTDSKLLSKKKREALNDEILEKAAAVGLGWVSASEIDELGLTAALKEAVIRALSEISVPYHEIIIDGTVNFLKDTGKGPYVTTMKKADLLIPSVSAASIIAKVARDRFMAEQDKIYPGYGFASHVGYGTAAHRAAIEALGVTPLHRLSFAPLMKYAHDGRSAATAHGHSGFAPRLSRVRRPGKTRAAGAMTHEDSLPNSPIITRMTGDFSETVATEELRRRGHTILERNWKTKYCEIDIVSRKSETLYFVEVKHRKKADQGGGLAAITPKKLKKMEFAARVFIQSQKATEYQPRLAVITTTGEPPAFETFLELG